MSVKLKTPSNGSVTLAPEDTASDVTLTVPAGTSSLVSNTTLRTELNATGSAPIYACRAWCNFDGTGTVAIRASGNVSSITDFGAGEYGINFTTAMPDTNYAGCVTIGCVIGGVNIVGLSAGNQTRTKTTSTFPIGTVLGSNANTSTDYSEVYVSIFR
jgi:hypothetical protein